MLALDTHSGHSRWLVRIIVSRTTRKSNTRRNFNHGARICVALVLYEPPTTLPSLFVTTLLNELFTDWALGPSTDNSEGKSERKTWFSVPRNVVNSLADSDRISWKRKKGIYFDLQLLKCLGTTESNKLKVIIIFFKKICKKLEFR